MSFTRIQGVLHAEQCSLQQLAQQFGTPLYVYSKATFEKHYLDMDRAFHFIDHQICFAVKSNLHCMHCLLPPGLLVNFHILCPV